MANEELISIDQLTGTIDSQEDSTVPLVDEQDNNRDYYSSVDEATIKAQKVNFAAGDRSRGVDAYTSMLMNGEEGQLQEEARERKRQDRMKTQERLLDGALRSGNIDEASVLTQINVEEVEETFPLEREYADMLLSSALALTKPEEFGTDGQSMVEATEPLSDLIVSRENAQRVAGKVHKTFKNSSWGQFGWDIARLSAPGVSWYQMSQVLKTPIDNWLPGNDLKEQIVHYYSLPPEEGAKLLDEKLTEMSKDNPTLALQVATAFVSYSGTDQFMDNVVTPTLDIGPLALGRTVRTAVTNPKVFGSYMKNTLKATFNRRVPREEDVIGAAGDVGQAAEISASKHLSGERPLEPTDSLSPALTVGGDLKNLSREFAERLVVDSNRSKSKLRDRLFNERVRGERLPLSGESIARGLEETRALQTRTYSHLVDSIVHYGTELTDANVTVSKVYFGALGENKLFDTAAQAERIGKQIYRLKGAEVEQYGDKFALVVRTPVDETSPGVFRAMVGELDSGIKRGSLTNPLFQYLKGGSEKFSTGLLREMQNVDAGASRIIEGFIEELKPLRNYKNTRAMEDFLSFQRIQENPNTGTVGVTNNTIAEFETAWLQQTGRAATEKDVEVYFRLKDLTDTALEVTNYAFTREKERVGAVSLDFGGVSGIEGKLVSELPRPNENVPGYGLLVMEAGVPRRVGGSINVSRFLNEEYDDLLARGYKPMQLSYDGSRALEASRIGELIEGSVRFVMAKDVSVRPISKNQVPNREGLFHNYTSGRFVKQPRIETDGDRVRYVGDNNIIHVPIGEDGVAFTRAFNEAQEAFARGDLTASRRIVESTLPFTFQRFSGMFRGRTAFLDENVPVVLANNGQAADEALNLQQVLTRNNPNIRYSTWRDDPHNMYRDSQVLTEALERGETIGSVVRSGDREGAFDIKGPSFVNAVDSVSRSLQRSVNRVSVDDVKIRMANEFVSTFGHLLDVTDDVHKLRTNPFQFVVDKPTYKKGADKLDINVAENHRKSALQYFGHNSEAGQTWRQMRQNAAEALMRATGGSQSRLGTLLEPMFFSKEKDVTRMLRSAVFTTRIGLFNPRQLLVQSQTMVHAAALGGTEKALQGIGFYSVAKTIDMAPQLSDQVASKFSKTLGMSKDDIIESYNLLNRSGYNRIGRSHADLGDYLHDKLLKSGAGRFFDNSKVFFNTAEESVRTTAWNMAYTNRRQAVGKFHKFTDEDIKAVINEAETFAGDMLKASAARWQQGLMGVPTQFMSFSGRLMDQFWGTRLDNKQKANMLLFYSGAYGIPHGLTAPVGGVWPLHESIKQAMLDNGIEVNDDFGMLLDQGAWGVATHWLTGKETNIGEVLGPPGIGKMRDVLFSNKDTFDQMTETMFGPSGSMISNIFSAVAPLVYHAKTVAEGNPDAYPLTSGDLRKFTNLTAVTQGAMSLYDSIATNRIMNKHGIVMKDTDVDYIDGLLKTFVGADPKDLDGYYDKIGNAAAWKKHADKHFKLAEENFLKAHDTGGQPDIVEEYLRRYKYHMEMSQAVQSKKTAAFKRMTKKVGVSKMKQLEKWYANQNEKVRAKYSKDNFGIILGEEGTQE